MHGKSSSDTLLRGKVRGVSVPAFEISYGGESERSGSVKLSLLLPPPRDGFAPQPSNSWSIFVRLFTSPPCISQNAPPATLKSPLGGTAEATGSGLSATPAWRRARSGGNRLWGSPAERACLVLRPPFLHHGRERALQLQQPRRRLIICGAPLGREHVAVAAERGRVQAAACRVRRGGGAGGRYAVSTTASRPSLSSPAPSPF